MVIFVLDNESQSEGQKLSREMGLRIVSDPPKDYYLSFEKDQWWVRDPRQGPYFILGVEIEKELKRLTSQRLGFKKDLLCRAVGYKGQASYQVFDGTMGLAKDSLHLLSFGCSVIGCERNSVAYTLVRSAIEKEDLKDLNLEINFGETIDVLPSFAERVDCLYLDPMFENIKKKAAPKKAMAFLREMAQGPQGVQGVMEKAFDLGIKRLVVKRPINGENLGSKPNIVLEGSLIRYDVYQR